MSDDDNRLPTIMVPMNTWEMGWLMGMVMDRAKEGDATARSLYMKVREAAIASGVDWRYGDPGWAGRFLFLDRHEP